MKKRFLASHKMLAASLAFVVSIPSMAGAATTDQANVLFSDNELVPIRAVGESVGAEVGWDGNAQRVTVNKGNTSFHITLGSATAQLNGKSVSLTQNVQLLDGRTYVPLGFVNEAFGMHMKWDRKKNKPAIGDLRGFEPEGVPNGSKGTYDLTLNMSENGTFTSTAKIDVENVSPDAWQEIVFDLVANAFTAQNKTAEMKGTAEVNIVEVKLNDQKAAYTTDSDILSLPLEQPLQPGEKASVEIRYEFTVPDPGYRFATNRDNYFLAQWYPMLETYHNGWNRNKYWSSGESYMSDFSDFTLHYNLPKGYQITSSAEPDAPLGSTSGTVTAKNVKEVFVAVTKDMRMVSKMVDGVEVRVWARHEDKRIEEALRWATDAFAYYTKTIGKYPNKQVDIVLQLGEGGMEYSGIVMCGLDGVDMYYELVHEVAHQWFYGTVSNNPYHEGWIDEGLAEFTASLYRYDRRGMNLGDSLKFLNLWYSGSNGETEWSNLPINEYENDDKMHAFVYGQSGLKIWNLLFNRFGGKEEARRFLSSYYSLYAHKQVSTKEFVRYLKAYFPLDDEYFASWLKL